MTSPQAQGHAAGPGSVTLGGRDVPRVSTRLERADVIGAWKARWGIGRMSYIVAPGLYAVGSPDGSSPVLVTANYKMSFDVLRSALEGVDAWILTLDTKGINVWCAAGKGTFSTEELVRRVGACVPKDALSKKRLVLPQLGAPGVRSVEAAKKTGFKVFYGPVRAVDIPAYLAAGMKADRAMRAVRFDLMDRLAVVPVELVQAMKYLLPAGVLLHLVGGWRLSIPLAAGLLAGGVAAPAALPWLPFRSFSAKGAVAGLILGAASVLAAEMAAGRSLSTLERCSWLLLVVALSSTIAAFYTGASTFTSLSGVRRELRFAIPVQISAALAAAALWTYWRLTL